MAHEGWHRALDIQMDTHKWAISEKGRWYNIVFFNTVLEKVVKGTFDPDPNAPVDPELVAASAALAAVYGEALYRADTMYVTSDMLHILMAAAHDLPADAAFDEHVLITDRGFCLFEEPIVGTDSKGRSTCINGMVWFKDLIHRTSDNYELTEPELGLIIYFLVDPYAQEDAYNQGFAEHMRQVYDTSVPPMTLQHFYPVKFGQTVPDWDAPGSGLIREMLRLFLAMQLIAQQKIGTPMQMRPDRAVRKRAFKWDGRDRVITLITLRRKSVKKDDHEPQKVEWSRRWVVQGHWRRQWYPKSQTHDYVYIHEFVKGPEDKPLVITERRVFNFRR